jgi:hypothetical protein
LGLFRLTDSFHELFTIIVRYLIFAFFLVVVVVIAGVILIGLSLVIYSLILELFFILNVILVVFYVEWNHVLLLAGHNIF